MTIIKEGYRISVTTWENDGDNYKTKAFDGLTLLQTKFVYMLCLVCRSRNSRHDETCIGNMYDPSDDETFAANAVLIAAVKKFIEKHGRPSIVDLPNSGNTTLFFEEFAGVLDLLDEEQADDVFDILLGFMYDTLVHLGLAGGEFYLRVFDRIEIQYVPQDIVLTSIDPDTLMV